MSMEMKIVIPISDNGNIKREKVIILLLCQVASRKKKKRRSVGQQPGSLRNVADGNRILNVEKD